MRAFEVRPGAVPTWQGITPAGRAVAEFLARVRVTGDPAAAGELMTATVRCHQLTSEDPTTVLRTPGEYAEHVTGMFTSFGRFTYRVTDLLAEGDRVYVRWEQTADPAAPQPLVELGSAVYRVRDGRIAEYSDPARPSRTAGPARPHRLAAHRDRTTLRKTTHTTTRRRSKMTTTTTPTRTVNGGVLPAAGAWDIDPGHTDLRLHRPPLHGDEGPRPVHRHDGRRRDRRDLRLPRRRHHRHGDRRVRQRETRDEHMRSAELFDVATYPDRHLPQRRGRLEGQPGDRRRRTHHPRRHQERAARRWSSRATFATPGGRPRRSSRARTRVNREDFGVTWNVALEAGGVLVSKEIQIEIDLETVLRST